MKDTVSVEKRDRLTDRVNQKWKRESKPKSESAVSETLKLRELE